MNIKQYQCALELIVKAGEKAKDKFLLYNNVIDTLNIIQLSHYASIMYYYEGRKMKEPLGSRSLASKLMKRRDRHREFFGLGLKESTILRNALSQCRP